MAIFVIFNVSKPDAIKHALAASYPDNWLEVKEGQYLLSAPVTTKEVSDR